LDSASLRYHEATKHHFNRFARALGYLDWATQPDPFRRYAGAPLVELPREPLATDVPYSALYDPDSRTPPRSLDAHSIGEFLRCSMGLSAWKQYGTSRWALRVNPSSGNLHPTASARRAQHRRISPLFDGPVGMEAVRHVALGAEGQPFEWKPAPHRDVRDLERARVSLRGERACARRTMCSSGPCPQTPAPFVFRGVDVDSLARGLEVR
jgi:hypothetical protein